MIPHGRWAVFLSLLAWAFGCAHTGPVAGLDGARTIAVPIVENRTYEYGAEERITDVLVQEFLRDGRLRVVSSEEADLRLQGTLVRYRLRPISFNADEQAIAFDLQTELKVKLIDQRSGKVLAEEQTFGDSGVFFLSNRPEARREEQIYRRLAEAVISRLLDDW